MKKILHFSPVSKSSSIVKLHLNSLGDLDSVDFNLTYSFFDDTIDTKSSDLISEFISKKSNSKRWEIEGLPEKENSQERWSKNAYSRITFIKDYVIDQFLLSDADYLFLTDSDLVIHPLTLRHLVEQDKDFISMIFWTHFEGRPTYFPNAWMNHPKTFSTFEEFIDLKKQKVIPVDFTGALTLLSRKILETGVRFERVPQVSALGEDKHFCVRAGVNGFQPYLSTHYPAFHIYKNNLIKQATDWIESEYNFSYLDKWLNENWEKEIKNFYDGKIKNISILKKTIGWILK